jgi:hypothetical protein
VVAGKGRAPVFQHAHQQAGGDMPADHLILHRAGQPMPRHRQPHRQRGIVHHRRAIHAHVQRLAVLLELPGIKVAARGHAQVDAAMARQIARVLRRGMLRQIGGRSHHRHAQIGADAQRDHVLFQAFAQPHPGIETLGHDVGQRAVE